MTNTALKAQIDSQITNETTPAGITPTEVGTNLKSIVDYIDQQVPKIYVATLTQSGAGSPVATVIKNDLSDVILWERIGAGNYKGTLVGAFTLNKTLFSIAPIKNITMNLSRVSADIISLQTVEFIWNELGYMDYTPTDDYLLNTPIKIEVYN